MQLPIGFECEHWEQRKAVYFFLTSKFFPISFINGVGSVKYLPLKLAGLYPSEPCFRNLVIGRYNPLGLSTLP